jgi:hypothetical protein
MRKVARVLGLLFIAFAPSVRAGEFKVDGIAIDVPTRFEGPASAQPDTHARTYVFTVRANNALSASTVLQVTASDLATEAQAGGSGLADISQRYLLQMLQGIERRRTEYRKSASKEIRLAGFPGSVVSWQGKANGIGTNGKMYCIVAKSELLFFHVMGGGSVPNADMAAAIRAVESARKY